MNNSMCSSIQDQLQAYDDSLSYLLTHIGKLDFIDKNNKNYGLDLDANHSLQIHLQRVTLHLCISFLLTVETYMLGLYSICILWSAPWSYRFASFLHNKDLLQIVSLQIKQSADFEADLRFGMELNYCQGFIVSEQDAEVFLETYQLLSKNIQRRVPWYKFIFITGDLEKNLANYTNYLVFHDSPNILFVEKTKGLDFNLWTTKFTGQSDNEDLILLDTFDGGSWSFQKHQNLFPDKLSNLMGRSLILGTFTYKPYTIIHEANDQQKTNIRIKEGSTTNDTYLDGTEGRLLIFFCAIYNCTLEVLVDDDNEWGAAYSNYTGNGILGHLLTRNVEIIMCALYLWYPEHLYYHFSTVISRTGVTCVVPIPKRAVSWFLPLQPFSSELWAAILIAFLTISTMLGISYAVASKGYHKILLGAATTFRVWLSQPIRRLPATLSGSLFLFCCLMIGFTITNIYGSGLSSFLTLPNYEEAIDTKEQLAEKQQPWGATSDAWILIIKLSEEPIIKTIVQNFVVLPENELLEKGKTGRFAFSVERLPYAGDYITVDAMEFLQPMLGDIYFQYCVLMSFKTWPLMEQFNDFILRVQQSGIQDVLERDVVTRYLNLKIQLELAVKRQVANQREPRVLVMQDILGIVMIWIIGILLSTFAFFMELLKKKLETMKIV